MTEEEFVKFTNRLFTEYPSLHGWLKHNSPDSAGTLRHWFRQLKDYTYLECIDVLAGWEKQTADPFGYNSRDVAMLIIRSVVDKAREKEMQRRRVAEIRRQYKQPRGVEVDEGLTRHFDSEMKEAFIRLSPLRKKVDDGSITMVDYEKEKDKVFAELKIGSRHGQQETEPQARGSSVFADTGGDC